MSRAPYPSVLSSSSISEQATQGALGLGEGLLEVLQVFAEPEPQERRHPEVLAGDEQDTVLRADLLDDFRGGDCLAIARPADRPRLRGMPGEGVAEALEPRFHHGIVGVQDAARALEQFLAYARVERHGPQVIGGARGTDRRVVMARPDLLRDRRRRNDPADAQARKS